ncbi:23S rRNA pseudouridine(2604) synthase RluF [Mycoplasmatota bacterium]|nr:23S rRNA pseudouridine(2604) synthase RluF [Mycoplasmatota bacterium]
MRINKYISESGICSRREADRLIENKRVKINGQIAEIGSQVSENDRIEVDGKIIERKDRSIYIALNKPVGITSTTDRSIEGNIVDFINHKERIFHIGRLDKDSEGLILMTNNGDIVNEILRAENNHEKEYIVTVNKKITDEFIINMSKGVRILGTTTKPCKVSKLNDRIFKIIITQGLNRQIRRMCQVFNYKVVKLQRVRIMNIHLGNLKIGEWRYLTPEELHELMNLLK